jgi:hypothetical protein
MVDQHPAPYPDFNGTDRLSSEKTMITYREYQDLDWYALCAIHDRAIPGELKGSCDPCGFIPIEQDPESGRLEPQPEVRRLQR